MTVNFFEHETTPQNSPISPVENLAIEVSDAFTRLSNILNTSSILPSFSSVIGSYLLLDVNYHGFEEDYTESFSLENSNKDIVLTAEPTDIISVSYLNVTTNTEVYLTSKLAAQAFTDKRQYKVIGKVLSVSGDLSNVTLKVRYKGLRKTFGNLKLRPNVVKNSNNSFLVNLVRKSNKTYSLTYDQNISTNFEKIFGNQTIDPSRVYLLIKDGEEFKTVEYTSAYASGRELVFNLKENLDDDYSAVVYTSNITISEFLEAFYKEFLNHSHSKDGSENLIAHNDLLDLYKNTSTIFYKDIGIVNYDHPQYLNREGYNASLTAVYENAMLGDLFLASKITENDQEYKTLLKNSNSILFGDPIRGSKIYYDTYNKAINILSGNNLNGLNINVSTEHKALMINNTSFLQETDDSLNVYGKKSVVKIIPLNTSEQSTLIADNIEGTSTVTTPSLSVGEITIGNVLVTKEGDNIHVGLKDPSVNAKLETTITSEFTDLNAQHFNAANILVGDNDRISVDSDNYLTKHEKGFDIKSEGDLKLTSSGIHTGVRIGKSDDLSVNVYTADYLGQPSSNIDTSVYVETPKQTDTYFLQSTNDQVSYGENTYKFRGEPEAGVITIENLKEWRRSNIHTGNVTAYGLNLRTTDGIKKNGLVIGETKISSIGVGLDCPAGMTLIESSDTVSIIKPLPEDEVECSDVNYQSLNAGATQVFGMLSVDDSILAVENITAGESLIGRTLNVSDVASIKTLNVQTESVFSGSADFNGTAQFYNSVDITGSLDVAGSVSSTSLDTKNYVSVGGTLTVEGQSILKNNVIIEGQLSTAGGFTTIGPIQSDSLKTGNIEAESIKSVGGLQVEGQISLTGPTDIDGSLKVNGNALVQGSFEATSEVTANSLYVTESTVMGGRLTVQESVILEGSSIAIGKTGSTVTITGTLQLDAPTTTFTGAVRVFKELNVAENLKVAGDITTSAKLAGTTLDVSAGGSIGGLLKADAGEFNRKTYFVEGLKANGDSEFTRIRAAEATTTAITTDTIFVKDQLTMGPESTLKTENLITAEFTQTSASANVRFSGTTQFLSPSKFNKQIIVGNDAIESGRNTSGVLITDREITMGNNSIIKATKIFATKGAPIGSDTDKNAGFCFESASNNGGTDGDTGFFASQNSGNKGSDLEFWIDGSLKGKIPSATTGYNSLNTDPEVIVTVKMLKEALTDMNTTIGQMNQSIGDRFWPIGSIFMSTDSRSPDEMLGFGSWVRFSAGRALVGCYEPGSSEGQIMGGLVPPAEIESALRIPGTAFGEYTHQLTVDEMPSHQHPSRSSGGHGSRSHGSGGSRYFAGSGSTKGWIAPEEGLVGLWGGDKPHNNVQPSISVNIWKRFR